jgi:hypothetical protein
LLLSVVLDQSEKFRPVFQDPWTADDTVEFDIGAFLQYMEWGIMLRCPNRLGAGNSEMPTEKNGAFQLAISSDGVYEPLIGFLFRIELSISILRN